MFGMSFEHLLILLIAALFILGPQRLPDAAAWLGRAVRQIRDYTDGARQQIRSELGPEFDELRKPLQDLNSLRMANPTSMARRYLLDGATGATASRAATAAPIATHSAVSQTNQPLPSTVPPNSSMPIAIHPAALQAGSPVLPTVPANSSMPIAIHPAALQADQPLPLSGRPPFDPEAT
jgi:sec-independent protein translocase protein TatB